MAFQYDPVKDRLTEFPNGVVIDGNPSTIERNNGEVYEPGTPINAALFNSIQAGLQSARQTYVFNRDPTAADNESSGFLAGDQWLNVAQPNVFVNFWVCVYCGASTATWRRTIPTSANPLSVEMGGTGGNTPNLARQGLGIRIYVSTVSVTIAANQTIGSAAITFPSGRFSAAPYVFTGILSGNPEYATSSYAEASVTGATVYAGRSIAASSATTITVRFIAIQGIG